MGDARSKVFVPPPLEDITNDRSPTGRTLGDDMSVWDAEDRKKAEMTIEKIAALGWVQRDMRGSNFVRLRKRKEDFVAMIDFESVEVVAAPHLEETRS